MRSARRPGRRLLRPRPNHPHSTPPAPRRGVRAPRMAEPLLNFSRLGAAAAAITAGAPITAAALHPRLLVRGPRPPAPLALPARPPSAREFTSRRPCLLSPHPAGLWHGGRDGALAGLCGAGVAAAAAAQGPRQ
jgi:hypothetical protein